MKRNCCCTWLLNVKIAFGLFLSALCVCLCVRAWAKEQSLPELLWEQPQFVPWELVLSPWIPFQMKCKTHTHRSRCLWKVTCLRASVLVRLLSGGSSRKKTLLNPQISLLGIECHTFKIIRLKWIESAGLSPHEQAAEIQWWGGMIMRPLTVHSVKAPRAEIYKLNQICWNQHIGGVDLL